MTFSAELKGQLPLQRQYDHLDSAARILAVLSQACLYLQVYLETWPRLYHVATTLENW